jgi:predicted NAD-dependent protein-ADP-ribosyltransferase YbiA (DUF1768 family)
MTDGIDHINVYNKGHTPLGRMLSNFARTPFELNGLGFESVEAWWYWQMLPDDSEELRKMHGFNAKSFGSTIASNHGKYRPPSKEQLAAVYRAKVAAHPDLKKALVASTLPFDHYYDFGRGRVDTKWRWTGQLWNEIREELKRETAN